MKVPVMFVVVSNSAFGRIEAGPALKAAAEAGEPTLVDVICQPLDEAHALVSEWVA